MRFSIRACPMKQSFASLPFPFLYSRASGSVVLWWVAFERFSPWKSTDGLPGSSSVVVGGSPSFGLKLFRLAAASISVPSTVKCSSESRPRSWARPTTSSKSCWPTSCCSRRSRFLVNVGRVEARLDQVHVQEPAEQQVVLQLLAEGPLGLRTEYSAISSDAMRP